MNRLICLLIGLILTHSSLAQSSDLANSRAMIWQGKPLQVTLPVGQEILLTFDGDVRVGVPTLLHQSATVDSLRGTVYITATQAFESQRLQVERLRDGMRILVDVRAQIGFTTPTQIDILTMDEQAALNHKAKDVSEKQPNRLLMPAPSLLVRYAYQSLYSPAHAIEPLPGVSRQAMQIDTDIQSQAFPLWPVMAKPVAAWSLNEYTVTAVMLTHQNNETLNLDPRQVTANLYGLSFAFPDIGPIGTDSASNTAFMISKGPLIQSLPPKLIAVEAINDTQK